MSLNAQEVCLQAHIRKRSEYPHHRRSVAGDSSFTIPLIQQVPQLSLLMQALHSPLHSLLCISTTTVSHNHATTWSAYVGKNLGDCWCLQRLMKTLQNKWITRDKKRQWRSVLNKGLTGYWKIILFCNSKPKVAHKEPYWQNWRLVTSDLPPPMMKTILLDCNSNKQEMCAQDTYVENIVAPVPQRPCYVWMSWKLP